MFIIEDGISVPVNWWLWLCRWTRNLLVRNRKWEERAPVPGGVSMWWSQWMTSPKKTWRTLRIAAKTRSGTKKTSVILVSDSISALHNVLSCQVNNVRVFSPREAPVTSVDRRLWTPRQCVVVVLVWGSKVSSVGRAWRTATERTCAPSCSIRSVFNDQQILFQFLLL